MIWSDYIAYDHFANLIKKKKINGFNFCVTQK